MHESILIVDDSAFDRQLMGTILTQLGYKHFACKDGDEAMIILKEQKGNIKLLLLDIRMPNVDGISVLGHCKTRYPKLPVIVISVTHEAEEIEQVKKWGAMFISKPIEKGKIETAIKTVLQAA